MKEKLILIAILLVLGGALFFAYTDYSVKQIIIGCVFLGLLVLYGVFYKPRQKPGR